MTGNQFSWFALGTKPRHEKSVSQILFNKGLQSFLPLYADRHQWTDRVKSVHLPLFPGYVFCRFDYGYRLTVLTTPGVNSIIGFDNAPTPVSDEEIDRIQILLASGLPTQPWPYVRVGEPVRIDRGMLAGLEGVLIREKTALRVVVTVELLQRAIALEIDRDMISGIPTHSTGQGARHRREIV